MLFLLSLAAAIVWRRATSFRAAYKQGAEILARSGRKGVGVCNGHEKRKG